MLLPASKTHNKIVLRPPPGARFTKEMTIYGADVHIEFEKGQERRVIEWLLDWIDSYIEPEAKKIEAAALAKNAVKMDINSKYGKQPTFFEIDKLMQLANLVTESKENGNGESEDHGKSEE